jgi:2-polyprenyl-6-methoxyphenol hydroxylase-like FAD-dependent oxidoreductase
MTNALALAQALDVTDDVPTALAAWERSERPVTDSTQKYSRIYGKIGITWTERLLDLRSGLVWLLGKSDVFQKRANAAAHHFPQLDEQPVPERA